MLLLTPPENQPKMRKTLQDARVYALHLAPARTAGGATVCPDSTPGCRAACLYFAGRGFQRFVQDARIRRTRWLQDDPEGFLDALRAELGKLPDGTGVRLNATSDIPWEEHAIIGAFPKLRFYDYTKSTRRYWAFLHGALPQNYYLTFSRSERNEADCIEFLDNGGTVATPFAGKVLPEYFRGYPVLDGDLSDWRPRDPPGYWVGLRVKGVMGHRRAALRTGFAVPEVAQ